MGMEFSRRAFVRAAAGVATVGLFACGANGESDQNGAGGQNMDAVVVEKKDVESEPEDSPRLAFFVLHADTVDTLCMHEYEPYASSVDEKFDGTLAENNAAVSADRMGDVGWVQCYAIWTPDDCPTVSHREFYEHGAEFFRQQLKECADAIAGVRGPTDIDEALASGKVAAILTVENSCMIEEKKDLELVDEFEEDGVLVCGLTWNGANALAGGVSTNDGLSSLGKTYIKALENRKMTVDVSHLCDTSFWDVEKVAKRPYIATHSNARAVCNIPRNLTDDQFKAIRDRGGLVGLNLCTWFVHSEDRDYEVEDLLAHIEHWLDLGGEDVVAFGTDRDGSGMPDWIRDCSRQEKLYKKIAKHLDEEITHKLFYQNARDFFERDLA